MVNNISLSTLPEGFCVTPPRTPWGINFGGGLNSTALILECMDRNIKPDWILFADTGSELPETIDHVGRMKELVKNVRPDWPEIATVKWERIRGDIVGFEPLHENCLRTRTLPSKAYGLAGCTSKWKVQPMDKWRKQNGFDKGAFAVGYDAGENRRITSACKRGDATDFTAWYPLVAWGVDRSGCEAIVNKWGVKVGKSSCFMCPNLKVQEWISLKNDNRQLFDTALEIDRLARENNNLGAGGLGLFRGKLGLINAELSDDRTGDDSTVLEDRCRHGGCFT